MRARLGASREPASAQLRPSFSKRTGPQRASTPTLAQPYTATLLLRPTASDKGDFVSNCFSPVLCILESTCPRDFLP
jgi:hypothetical protein